MILRMKALRLGDIEDFPFLEAPPRKAISDGYQLLLELGAVDRRTCADADWPGTGEDAARSAARADDRRRARRGLPARGAGDRRRTVGAGSARAAAGAAGDGRRRAPQVRRREVGVSFLAQALGLVSGRGRTPQVTAQAGRGVPREFPLGAAHARVARHPQPVARAGGRASMARERLAGDLRRHPSRAARRAARQPRLQVGRVGALPRRARHQVPDPSGLGAAEEGRQVDRRRRDQRDHAPFRALRRAHRARVARTRRRASPQAQLVRPALGKEGDAGDRFRAHHALRHRRRCAPAGELRAAESAGGARDFHPPGAGRRRGQRGVRASLGFLHAQPAVDARDRNARAQVPPARRAGQRRADLCLLRPSDPAGPLQRRGLRQVAARGRARDAAFALPAARRPDAARGRRGDQRGLPASAAARRCRLRAGLPLRTRQPARWRDADRAAGAVEPDSGRALRVAGARPAQGEGGATGEDAAAAAARQAGAGARVRRRVRRAGAAGGQATGSGADPLHSAVARAQRTRLGDYPRRLSPGCLAGAPVVQLSPGSTRTGGSWG